MQALFRGPTRLHERTTSCDHPDFELDKLCVKNEKSEFVVDKIQIFMRKMRILENCHLPLCPIGNDFSVETGCDVQ